MLTGLIPTSAVAGDPGFTIIVAGRNFSPHSVLQWNHQARFTRFSSNTLLSARIAAADLASPGVVALTIVDSGTVSNALLFTINDRAAPGAPVLTQLNPSAAAVGSPAFQLQILGTHLTSAAVVLWNGQARTTHFVSSNEVRADLWTTDLATVRDDLVSVRIATHTSNALTFHVTVAPAGTPVLNSLDPASIAAGASTFTLTAIGTGFTPATQLHWNDLTLPTHWIDTTHLSADVPSNDVVIPGSALITAVIGAAVSNALTFDVHIPSTDGPTLTGLSPASTTAGAAALSIHLFGDNFTPQATAQWNNQDRPSHFVSSGELVMDIGAADIASNGVGEVSVVTNQGSSNALPFLIQNRPIAALADLNSVRVFPNPWIAGKERQRQVTFDHLTAGSTLRIFTVSGQWVKSLRESGGSAIWDLTTDSGDNAASGYYVYVIEDPAGHQLRGKLALIR